MFNRSYFRVLVISILLGVIGFYLGYNNYQKEIREKVESSVGGSVLMIEGEEVKLLIADSMSERTIGLGGRESLPEDTAMLFIFDRPDLYGIWMKNMMFPIDVMWLDENYTIVNIVEGMSHLTPEQIYLPTQKSLYILEGNSGFVAQNEIEVGNILDIRLRD